MRKLAVYESWKDYRNFTKEEIKRIYNIDEDFDYYCDYIKSRISLENRPNLNRLKEDIKNNKVSKVIIRSMNHLSRDMMAFFSFIDFASEYNCIVIDTNNFNYVNYYKNFKDSINQTIEENKKFNTKESEEVCL